MKKKRLIKTVIIVFTLSIITVGHVFAESLYTTKDRLSSKGKIIYKNQDETSEIVADANDYVIIANAIDNLKAKVTAQENTLETKITDATNICR